MHYLLLIQRTQSGVQISSFTQYFKGICSLSGHIYANPILNLDAMQKLARMTITKKLKCRISGLNNLSFLSGSNPAVNEISSLSEEFQAPIVELTLSVGRSKELSLSTPKVKLWVDSILRLVGSQSYAKNHQGPQASIAQVTGYSEDDEGQRKQQLCIDLIQDRMREKICKPDKARRNLSLIERVNMLKKAWSNRAGDLSSMFEL
jgi:hypothetical protein